MTFAEFFKLLALFTIALSEAESKRTQAKVNRKRIPGGGRKSSLTTNEDKLLFILTYIKVYPTQDLQGIMFGLSQPTVCEWVQRLLPVLQVALGKEIYLPVRPPVESLEVLFQRCPQLRFIIDGTERPIQRPSDSERQRKHYSGKKKRHTVKNTVITDADTKKIVFLGKTFPGSTHDKTMADEDKAPFPPGSKLWKDTGYQGYEPEGVECKQPKKKPRGGELNAEEKAQNKLISQDRIGVEHSIGGSKVFGIVVQPFRNRRENMIDDVMETSSGLHNFKLDCRLKKVI